MPTVHFRGEEIECREGATLRDVLLDADLTPHNGKATVLNCRGFGNCGTCAVKVDGEVTDKGIREKGRLLVPPHHPNYDLRLACQTKVMGDVTVEKYPGMWGTKMAKEPLPPLADEAGDADANTADDDTDTPSDADDEPIAADAGDDQTTADAD
ncbi:MAG: ferredoxin [Halonotius sp. J07HN4]|nr:MAG: ferredoxin [Halonotius sp. J07HN4]